MLDQLTVLILEDHPFQRSALQSVLTQIGVGNILEAADGYEAIRVLNDFGQPADLVLCDLRMEGMDGVEFIRHVRQSELAHGVILTSSLDEELVRSVETMAFSQGVPVFGRLQKPITAEALAPLLQNYALRGDGEDSRFEDGVPKRTVDEVRRALTEERFIPYLQPKVRLSDGTVVGAEALARWNHTRDGILGPAVFIPVMEDHGMADDFTLLMIRESLRSMRTLGSEGLDIPFSVNISAPALLDTELPVRVRALLDDLGVAPDKLVLEITESTVVENLAKSLETITRLRMYGVGLSIDDFGTGYSSLQQLSRAPFTEIKIDRSFVSHIDDEPKHQSIVASTIRLANDLGMACVAEGAEREEEVAMLRRLGCDVIQGFYFARPMSPEALIQWHRDC